MTTGAPASAILTAMNCDIPIPVQLQDDERDALGDQVSAEFPKLFIRLRPVDAGDDNQVTVEVPPAPPPEASGAYVIQSLDDAAQRSQIRERVTEIRDTLLRACRLGP